jgi:hypothetical protein
MGLTRPPIEAAYKRRSRNSFKTSSHKRSGLRSPALASSMFRLARISLARSPRSASPQATPSYQSACPDRNTRSAPWDSRHLFSARVCDGAVLFSIALQCGVPLDVIRGAITRNAPNLAAVPERGGDHDHKRILACIGPKLIMIASVQPSQSPASHSSARRRSGKDMPAAFHVRSFATGIARGRD